MPELTESIYSAAVRRLAPVSCGVIGKRWPVTCSDYNRLSPLNDLTTLLSAGYCPHKLETSEIIPHKLLFTLRIIEQVHLNRVFKLPAALEEPGSWSGTPALIREVPPLPPAFTSLTPLNTVPANQRHPQYSGRNPAVVLPLHTPAVDFPSGQIYFFSVLDLLNRVLKDRRRSYLHLHTWTLRRYVEGLLEQKSMIGSLYGCAFPFRN